jgi:hypothetical protein
MKSEQCVMIEIGLRGTRGNDAQRKSGASSSADKLSKIPLDFADRRFRSAIAR